MCFYCKIRPARFLISNKIPCCVQDNRGCPSVIENRVKKSSQKFKEKEGKSDVKEFINPGGVLCDYCQKLEARYIMKNGKKVAAQIIEVVKVLRKHV